MNVSGHLDLCGPNLVEGWIFDADTPHERIALQIFVGSELLGECSANVPRADLAAAGYGDGGCGFSFAVPERATELDFSSVRARVVGTVLFLLPDEFSNVHVLEQVDLALAPPPIAPAKATSRPMGRLASLIS